MHEQARRMVGIPPRMTGLSFTIWLLRQKPGRPVPMVVATPDPQFEADRAATFVIEPTLVQIEGPPMDYTREQALGSWVSQNFDLIMDYWDGRDIKIVPRLRKVAVVRA